MNPVAIVFIVIGALLAYFLFCPISYSFKGDIDNGVYVFHSSDLLRFFRVFYRKNSKESYFRLSVLFNLIKILPREKKQEKEAKKAEKKARKQAKKQAKLEKKGKKKEDKLTPKSVLQMISREEKRRAISILVSKIIKIIKLIIPKRLECDIVFGFSTPDFTGYITGILSMIPVVYEDTVNIQPDFSSDTSYVKGNFFIKGHICIIVVIVIFISILMDKSVRRLLKN